MARSRWPAKRGRHAERVSQRRFVVAEQEIDTSPLDFLAPKQIGEVGPAR